MSPALAASRTAGDAGERAASRTALRIGVDVGGTFTKAVAVEDAPFRLRAERVVPTTHADADGVMRGVADALTMLLADLDGDRGRVALVAFSTTQAMNALLEGDVPRVGVVGLGAKPDHRRARRRTRVGAIELAPGHSLETSHRFIDVTGGIDAADADAALEELAEEGCETIAVSGAFAVESPAHELLVARRARALGMPACCGHELSEAYGLETRTVSAAVNAAILPVVERTAGLVEQALAEAGLRVPLLVLRGDGGAMSSESFRGRPAFTVGSGPAAGVAAALHQAGAHDAVVVECGGTSTNVSVVRAGRPALRSIKVMGRPTAIRSIDSWVVGVAGGSMIRLGRRGIAGIGPRSAHVSGLPYASFAEPEQLDGGRVVLISPRPGDPASYVAVEAAGGRFALTSTCAANALGLLPPDAHAAGSTESARRAFAALVEHLGRGDVDGLARAALDAGLEQIEAAIDEAVRAHDLDRRAPLIALGGAGAALVPEIAARRSRPHRDPAHPEVLASIGAALTLIRTEVVRSVTREGATGRRLEVINAAERSCVDAGAAPGTVAVETSYDSEEGLLRAVATGAVALEAGATGRRAVDAAAQRAAAARALEVDPGRLIEAARNEFYATYEDEDRRVAIVDRLGSVPVVERPRSVVVGTGARFRSRLEEAIEQASLNLGITELIPRVTVVCGPHLLDLSDSRRPEELLESADVALRASTGDAVALVSR